MMEDKDKLIADKRVIRVEVKTKTAYEFGGRVKGKARTPFDGCFGTIIDVLGADRYNIQW